MFISSTMWKKVTLTCAFLHIRLYSCANIIYKPTNMSGDLSRMCLYRRCTSFKGTYTHPIRTCTSSLLRTCTFSENSSIFLSYFCEQLWSPPQRCGFVRMRDNIMGKRSQYLYFIDVYVLLACTYERLVTYAKLGNHAYICFLMSLLFICTHTSLSRLNHLFFCDVYVWISMFEFDF